MQKFKTSGYCEEAQCSCSLPTTAVVQCHCQNRRKLQGYGYSTWVAVGDAQFTVNSGEDLIKSYRVSELSSKYFFSFRGTGVYCINGKHITDHKVLTLGSVDDYSSELKPQLQTYTESKAKWI